LSNLPGKWGMSMEKNGDSPFLEGEEEKEKE
jgi:hypothetical protein